MKSQKTLYQSLFLVSVIKKSTALIDLSAVRVGGVGGLMGRNLVGHPKYDKLQDFSYSTKDDKTTQIYTRDITLILSNVTLSVVKQKLI